MERPDRTIDVAAVIESRPMTRFAVRLVIISWLITVFDGFDMMMISFAAPYMRDELHLTTRMLGDIFSAGLFGMMLGSLVFSWIADRIGRRPAVVTAAFAFGVLTIATAFARSYPALLTLRLLDGFALGGMLPIAWALNTEFVPRQMRSTVVTIIMVGYSIGSAIAGPLTNLIAPVYGWEGVFIVGGGGTLVCATLLLLWLPESVRFLVTHGQRPDLIASTLNRIDPQIGVLRGDRFILGDEPAAKPSLNPALLFAGRLRTLTPLIWIGYTMSSFTIFFSASWGPLLLEELHIQRHLAASMSSLGGILGAVAGLLLMRFTDRKGPLSVAVYPAIVVPVLLLLGLGLVPDALFLAFVVLATVLIGGGHFGMLSIVAPFYPSAIRASGAGWATFIGKAGAVLGPIFGGMILSSGVSVLRTYALLALCPCIMVLCILGIVAVVRRPMTTKPAADPLSVL